MHKKIVENTLKLRIRTYYYTENYINNDKTT